MCMVRTQDLSAAAAVGGAGIWRAEHVGVQAQQQLQVAIVGVQLSSTLPGYYCLGNCHWQLLVGPLSLCGSHLALLQHH